MAAHSTLSEHASDPLVDVVAWPAAPTVVPGVMRATAFDAFGPPDVLSTRVVATPDVRADEVLVRVAAVSVGRLLDLTARAGTHPFAGFALPHVLGAEHAGTVAAVGSEVTSVAIGDHVAVFPVVSCARCDHCRRGRSEACSALEIIGVHRPGAYAQYCAVPATNVQRVPADIDAAQAAALALAGPVAMNQLTQAGLQPGDWVLVQGAASGLGSLTASLAGHLGAQVIGTSRSARKREAIGRTDVAACLDPTAPEFVNRVMELTGGHGVAIAVDNLGEPAIWNTTTAALATLGTVVTSGAFLGGKVGLDLARLYLRCQRIIGVRTGTLTSAQLLWAEVARGFRPRLDRTFALSDAADAHRYLEHDENFGRVALVVEQEAADSLENQR